MIPLSMKRRRSLMQAAVIVACLSLFILIAHYRSVESEYDPSFLFGTDEESKLGVVVGSPAVVSPPESSQKADDGKLLLQEPSPMPQKEPSKTNSSPKEKAPEKSQPAEASPKTEDRPKPVEINSNKSMNQTLVDQSAKYIKAILDPADINFPRLECPLPLSSLDRYAYLRAPEKAPAVTAKPKYFFTLDLWQVAELLPRLIGSILEAVRFLGPENCVLSVVEGRSNDGTYEILRELAKEMEKMGLRYILSTDETDPKGGPVDRIEALANLRNLALKDLWEHSERYDKDTIVIFSNDVALCLDDVLELIHQKQYQGADMMCAMDWLDRKPLWFYDLWVARGINGDSFLKITPKTKDEKGEDVGAKFDTGAGLFWNDEKTRSRYEAYEPFQVFTCWNGIVAFTAKPMMEEKIKFRGTDGHHGHECYQSEPSLFTKDLWYHGYGKIGVVPSINLAYSDEEAKVIREQRGYVSQHLGKAGESKIEWQKDPPKEVMCLPEIDGPHLWKPWNEKLPGAPPEKEEPKKEEPKKEEPKKEEPKKDDKKEEKKEDKKD